MPGTSSSNDVLSLLLVWKGESTYALRSFMLALTDMSNSSSDNHRCHGKRFPLVSIIFGIQ